MGLRLVGSDARAEAHELRRRIAECEGRAGSAYVEAQSLVRELRREHHDTAATAAATAALRFKQAEAELVRARAQVNA